jgi:hypothetical protein
VHCLGRRTTCEFKVLVSQRCSALTSLSHLHPLAQSDSHHKQHATFCPSRLLPYALSCVSPHSNDGQMHPLTLIALGRIPTL